jgi:hypothetical protein
MAGIGVRKTGDWALARQVLRALPRDLATASRKALLQQAHALRGEIVQGLTDQAPGGAPLAPPSPLTLAARRLQGFSGTKSLIVRGDLRNSVQVVVVGDQVFVGISRTARGADGQTLVDVARVQEYGSDPIVIPITPAMRRYLAALFREAGKEESSGSGSGSGVVVVQVPARPFLRPAFDKFKVGAERRFLERVASLLPRRGG